MTCRVTTTWEIEVEGEGEPSGMSQEAMGLTMKSRNVY
jgi:hypothetical protein